MNHMEFVSLFRTLFGTCSNNINPNNKHSATDNKAYQSCINLNKREGKCMYVSCMVVVIVVVGFVVVEANS